MAPRITAGIFLLLVVLVAPSFPQEPGGAGSGVLFIASDPINCPVEVNGNELTGRTPLLLTGLEAGVYLVTISKEGFRPAEVRVEVTPGEPLAAEADLTADTVRPFFQSQDRIVVNSRNTLPGAYGLDLPEGEYRIRREEGVIYLDPVYPGQKLLTAMHIGLPIMAVISSLLTVENILNPHPAWHALSPAAITSYVVTGGMLALDLTLLGRKRKFEREFPVREVPGGRITDDPAALYALGEQSIAGEQFQEAVDFYRSILTGFPDSPYYPQALYKLARIHYVLGDTRLSLQELRLVKNRYPLPDLYDKTCKNLADIYYSLNRYDRALEYLDQMVFYDPLHTRESVDFYKAQIRERQYTAGNLEIDRVIRQYRGLLEEYGDSENRPQYAYTLAYYLYLDAGYREAFEILEDIEAADEDLSRSIRELRREVEASLDSAEGGGE
jgi:outer membrane protein assembly factor BamD (BamD/ComL family)